MPLRGHIRNGNVVLDDAVRLPDGAQVTVEIVASGGAGRKDPFWGLLSGDSALLDQVVTDAMKSRSERRLRTAHA